VDVCGGRVVDVVVDVCGGGREWWTWWC